MANILDEGGAPILDEAGGFITDEAGSQLPAVEFKLADPFLRWSTGPVII